METINEQTFATQLNLTTQVNVIISGYYQATSYKCWTSICSTVRERDEFREKYELEKKAKDEALRK